MDHAGFSALAGFVAATLRGETPPPLPEGIAALAQAHRLAGLLHHHRAPLHPADAARCAEVWRRALWAHLRRLKTWRQVWPEAAPAPLLIKGADLAERLYQDPGARPANDLDLLVTPAAFEPLRAALSAQADEIRSARYERHPWERAYSLGFLFDGALIELHAGLLPPHRGGPSACGLWHRGEAARLQGRAIRYPTPVDRLLITLTNIAKDGGRMDLLSALELGLLLSASGLGRRGLGLLAAHHGLGRVAWLSRARLDLLLRAPSHPRLPWLLTDDVYEPNHALLTLGRAALTPTSGLWGALRRAVHRRP
ncbi:nucleotidyltransferase family protein [Myxococcota bacterium]|nr:nucleotidyltransferase family protein [Myxococcota bacterium]MBU1431694.1 nucleotidyltransferase family protein [Myxococcota bacterium]MBU1898882.1 nucleotidyltransferase family protein [Myxococcota bacterium]